MHLRTVTVVVRARGHISCSLINSVERHREKFVLKLFGVEVSSPVYWSVARPATHLPKRRHLDGNKKAYILRSCCISRW